MSGALFDSNILIDLFNGVDAAAAEWARYARPAISVVTWIEVMAGVDPDDAHHFRSFLNDLDLIVVTPDVAPRAATIRGDRRIKLPDAIIQASAESRGLTLITRNERDFPEGPVVRIPYRL